MHSSLPSGLVGIARGDAEVGLGVPFVEVHPVQDADEVRGAESKETVEPEAVIGGLDLRA